MNWNQETHTSFFCVIDRNTILPDRRHRRKPFLARIESNSTLGSFVGPMGRTFRIVPVCMSTTLLVPDREPGPMGRTFHIIPVA
jgi:hypothetical protein